MTPSNPSGFTPEELRYLQRLKDSVADLQNTIAPQPADVRSDIYNEQFNQLRLEAKALLMDPEFEQKVPRAITESVWTERSQKTIFPRLSAITFLGVILALIGLGVNSVVLDDVLINSIGCCISGGGILLVIGAFAVWGLVSTRRRVSNMGDLYVRSESLMELINQTLDTAVPSPAAGPSPVPSSAELVRDSLRSQVAYWQEALRELESQRLAFEPEAPADLTASIDFARQELNKVTQDLYQLQGRPGGAEPAAADPGTGTPSSPQVIVPTASRPEPPPRVRRQLDSQAVARARSNTIDMPVVGPEEEAESTPEEEEDNK